MSCYSPLLGIKNLITDDGKISYSVVGKAKSYEFAKQCPTETILIPCGKCTGCRIDKSRKWADRMCLEYDHTKKAVFVTLTYDDEHLPKSPSGVPTLRKEDLQTFMKDLRGNKYYDGKEIRFYACGEYGNLRQRPHYHVILFGLGLDDFSDDGNIYEFHTPEYFVDRSDHQLYYDGQNELHQPYYRCPHIDNIVWKKGRTCIAEFSWKSAAYTARYVRKKLDGPLGAEVYCDRLPPFALMSRRPGIAGYFMEDHPEKDFFEEQTFSFQGKTKPIPDFLFDKLEKVDPVRYSQVKEQRRKFADDKLLLELQQTDLSFEELLTIKKEHFEAVSTNLKRPLE